MENCLIIAGEKSGEEHCLSFFDELKTSLPEHHFFGVGGDQMRECGVELIYHLRDFSSMGFSEVVGKIPFYLNAMKKIIKEVERRKCSSAILIDFQGFNLRLAKKLQERGVKVFYYVAPQAWAWKSGRAKTIEKCVHTLFTIIPFEKKWFQDRGVKRIQSVPHPVWIQYKDEIEQLPIKSLPPLGKRVTLLLLPGSRNFEVEALLPFFVRAAQELKKTQQISVSLVRSSSVKSEIYDPFLSEVDHIYPNEELSCALKAADFSFAASGTVTLSLALFGVPSLITYKGSLFNKFVFDNFLNYDGYVGLANIVHGKEMFPEYVQDRATVYNLVRYGKKLMNDNKFYNCLAEELFHTKELLKGERTSVAEVISSEIKKDERRS